MNLSDSIILQKRQLVGLLELACRELELTETQYELANERYQSAARWLATSGDPVLADASMSPQGSMRLRTTVRPTKRNEFDLDFVTHLPYLTQAAPVDIVHAIVGNRLRENATYSSMLEPSKRGWRLNYANDFHLDVTPSITDPLNSTTGALLVPDKSLQRWKPSNPKGYASWFDLVANLRPSALHKLVADRARIDPLPENESFRGPLRRIVQIIKRHRDLHFDKKLKLQREAAPISVVLTTLAAYAYEVVVPQVLDTELDLLETTVVTMPRFITYSPHRRYWIANPTNQNENFAEKWNAHPERAVAFFEWHGQLARDIRQLQQVQGLDTVGGLLANMLGERPTRDALRQYSDRIQRGRAGTTIAVKPAAGALGIRAAAGTLRTPHNTFFGRE